MKIVVIALTALTLAASQIYAAPIAQDTQELQLYGGIDVDSAAGTQISLNAGYGYFIADYLEVGGLFGFSDDDIVTSFAIGGFAEYNIETESDVIPFVGTQLRLIDVDIDLGAGSSGETAGALGLYAGVKFFITEGLAISIRSLVETATEDIYLEDDDVNNVDIVFDLGLRYFY
jgi:hypothetical protein